MEKFSQISPLFALSRHAYIHNGKETFDGNLLFCEKKKEEKPATEQYNTQYCTVLYLMHYAFFFFFFVFVLSPPPTHFLVTFLPSFFSQLVLFLTHLHSLRTFCDRFFYSILNVRTQERRKK